MTHFRIAALIFAATVATAMAQQSQSTATAQTQPQQSQQPAQAQKDSGPAPSEITIHTVGSEKDNKKKDSQSASQQVYQMPKLANEPMSHQTRVMVMRSLEAEFVFARKALPLGQRGVVLKEGRLSPADAELARMVATYGPAVKPGDRAQITDVRIGDKTILFELNGGPKKKKKWYQHIEIAGMGGSTPVSQQDPNQANAMGTTVELAFDKFVPEMTGDQVRELLSPVLDFHAKSAAEAYIDTVPPKVKEAIKTHQVLVGMNREMVEYSKGRPQKKIREKDEQGKEYEEWMYGEPPQEVQFVRFMGDQVTQLKIMTVDGQKIVRTEKEVNLENGVATLAKKVEDEPKPAHAPSLKRPGEEADKDAPIKRTGANTPQPNSTHQDDEWGVPKGSQQGTGSQQQGSTTDPNAPKPPDNGASVPK